MADDADKASDLPDKLTLHYIKSNFFRVVHCDGIIGGPSPDGRFIHGAIVNNRQPLPLQVTHRVEGHVLKEELSRVCRDGCVREVEVDLVIPVEMVESVAKWLLAQLEIVQKGNQSP